MKRNNKVVTKRGKDKDKFKHDKLLINCSSIIALKVELFNWAIIVPILS